MERRELKEHFVEEEAQEHNAIDQISIELEDRPIDQDPRMASEEFEE